MKWMKWWNVACLGWGAFGYTQGNACCVSHLQRPLKSALSILCFRVANMWGVTWYCTRAWTTYNISKQFPNCFQAKVDSTLWKLSLLSNFFIFLLLLSFFFPVFIHRLENIKVLSKLDPGRTNSLRNSCIQCHISDSQVSGFPSLWMVTMWGNSDTSSQCTLTFVVCDENVFTKTRSDLPGNVYVDRMHYVHLIQGIKVKLLRETLMK